MANRILMRVVIFFLTVVCSGCAINYKNLGNTDQYKVSNVNVDKAYYRVKDLAVFATPQGLKAVDDTLKGSHLFSRSEKIFDETIPDDGFYINVEPAYKAPTLAAAGFGYLSLSTLTLLPAWSNHDGFTVTYTVYNKGELVKTFQYHRERFVALWLPILPFAWINLLTDGEYEVFASTTNEFLGDLDVTLKNASQNY